MGERVKQRFIIPYSAMPNKKEFHQVSRVTYLKTLIGNIGVADFKYPTRGQRETKK